MTDPATLPAEPLITTVTLAELTVGWLWLKAQGRLATATDDAISAAGSTSSHWPLLFTFRDLTATGLTAIGAAQAANQPLA